MALGLGATPPATPSMAVGRAPKSASIIAAPRCPSTALPTPPFLPPAAMPPSPLSLLSSIMDAGRMKSSIEGLSFVASWLFVAGSSGGGGGGGGGGRGGVVESPRPRPGRPIPAIPLDLGHGERLSRLSNQTILSPSSR
jgi:hypothetical protein